MTVAGRWFFGDVQFGETEQMLEFQYRFLMVLLAFGALATGVFLVTGQTEQAPLPKAHQVSMRLFTLTSFVLWLVLRGRKRLFLPIAWTYELAAILENTSTMVNVPGDELRMLWLFTNIPGVYLLLGRKAGAAITALTMLALVAGNPFLSRPYSPNALATAVVSTIYLGAFFHAYSNQTLTLYVRLREMALKDTLTGVFNARAFYAMGERLLKAAERKGTPSAILFVDLDHFKSINDTWGHAAGDAVLRAAADCLRGQARGGDLVGRIGGEEFSIFLPETDLEAARTVAERVRWAIEQLRPQIDGQRVPITASVGVASAPAAAAAMPSIHAIQRQADAAMYEAKRGGRNRVSVFTATA